MIGAFIILVIVVIVFFTYSRYIESKLLTGFWKADADFCMSADVEVFLVYMGPGGISNKRPGYILVKNAEGLIINSPVEFQLVEYIWQPWVKDRVFKANIKWTDDAEYDFFPSKQQIYYYPFDDKLVFMADDEVYAVLYKDGSLIKDV